MSSPISPPWSLLPPLAPHNPTLCTLLCFLPSSLVSLVMNLYFSCLPVITLQHSRFEPLYPCYPALPWPSCLYQKQKLVDPDMKVSCFLGMSSCALPALHLTSAPTSLFQGWDGREKCWRGREWTCEEDKLVRCRRNSRIIQSLEIMWWWTSLDWRVDVKQTNQLYLIVIQDYTLGDLV